MELEQYKKELEQRKKRYKQVFSTTAGEAVLKELKSSFLNRPLKGDDSHDTYYRVGQRDLVQYITDLVESNNGQ